MALRLTRWNSPRAKGCGGWAWENMSRCMRDLWIVRKPGDHPALVVLVQLFDERVALAQLCSEESECIPPLSGSRHNSRCLIWGERGTGYNAMTDAIPRAIARTYRGSLDVPRCHEVLAVVPDSSSDIIVVHRMYAKAKPTCWVAAAPQEARYPTYFLSYNAPGWGPVIAKGKGKQSGRDVRCFGSWRNRWCPESQVNLPDDFISSAPSSSSSGKGRGACCQATSSSSFCVQLMDAATHQLDEPVEIVRSKGFWQETCVELPHEGYFWRIAECFHETVVQPALP